MSSYIIEGRKILEGEVKVSGSKNASLPILAATILSGKVSTLYNVPNIKDVRTTLKILEVLGCQIKKQNNKVIIDSSKVNQYIIPEHLMRELRSSVILAGALIGRFKNAVFSYPGGCDIGSRPIDLHLNNFKKLGINIEECNGDIKCNSDKIIGNEVHLDFPSVGATENLILSSVLAEGETIIHNAALEPEIEDLQNLLNRMGAKVDGAGTSIIRIKGVQSLKNVSYNIMPDRIEAGTFLVMGAITNGTVKLENVKSEHINSILFKLQECGCRIKIDKNTIESSAPRKLNATDIKTMPYPGFPTDMQSIFVAGLTMAKGTSIVTENIFENRFKFISELIRMGAKIKVEGNTAIIKGVRKLNGANLKATDLRGGAAMVTAALAANGNSKIDDIGYILRGYEDFDNKLTKLGAKILVI